MAVDYLTGTTQIFDDGTRLTTYSDGVTVSKDLGGEIVAKKPDGTTIGSYLPTNITNGIASVLSTRNSLTSAVATATSAVTNTATISTSSSNGFRDKGTVLPNPLDGLATYNTLFTMAALSKEEVNNPFSYRNSGFSTKQVVLSSAGRYDADRAPTASGTPEYFINNFKMDCMLTGSDATGTSNAINISFDVIEPYSMGLFLQSLQYSAIQAGNTNYLNGAVYCMKMEFVGFDDKGQSFISVAPKYYLMILKKTTFTVNEGGSQYKFEAVPFNHNAFSDIINKVYTDISITGENVKELLVTGERSLQNVLNEAQEKKAKEDTEISIPDRYEIHFPTSSSDPLPGVNEETEGGATVNASNQAVTIKTSKNILNVASFTSNPIGDASFNFQVDSAGNYVAPKASDVHDEKTGKVDRDKVTVNAKKRTFQYPQNQSLTQIITQCILESDYAKKNLTAEPDANGLIDWFRIDMQVQIQGFDPRRGDNAKKIIIRVMPYKLHSSIFANPQSRGVGYDNLAGIIVKQYDYIYTGQNNDLLKFDIQINNAFYTAIAPTPDGTGGRTQNQDISSAGNPDIPKTEVPEGAAGAEPSLSPTGSPQVKGDSRAGKKQAGGSGNVTSEYDIANQFHKAFLNNQAEMIKINFDIMGDPYYLVDSGIGGYIAPAEKGSQVTSDGTANYEAGDTYIYLRFRTPVEPKENDGDYLFVDKADNPFSGIYKAIKVENNFKDGTFKQTITAIRMPLQASDFDGTPKATQGKAIAAMKKITGVLKEPTSPTDDTALNPGFPADNPNSYGDG